MINEKIIACAQKLADIAGETARHYFRRSIESSFKSKEEIVTEADFVIEKSVNPWNVLPVLFNMPLKNYVIATLVGSMPSMFVTVSFGDGMESVIDKNADPSILNIINSPEIYIYFNMTSIIFLS